MHTSGTVNGSNEEEEIPSTKTGVKTVKTVK